MRTNRNAIIAEVIARLGKKRCMNCEDDSEPCEECVIIEMTHEEYCEAYRQRA